MTCFKDKQKAKAKMRWAIKTVVAFVPPVLDAFPYVKTGHTLPS